MRNPFRPHAVRNPLRDVTRLLPAVTLAIAVVGAITVATAQPVARAPALRPATPASAASAPLPWRGASAPLVTRSPAVRAAENAREPGMQRPDERVVPQIAVPLRTRNAPGTAAAASTPAGVVPGAVNDDAARCLAVAGVAQRAACERDAAASAAPAR